jgi:predicted AAA+ superfamily ATPase
MYENTYNIIIIIYIYDILHHNTITNITMFVVILYNLYSNPNPNTSYNLEILHENNF